VRVRLRKPGYREQRLEWDAGQADHASVKLVPVPRQQPHPDPDRIEVL
jgi:hypothetical protein